MVGSVNSHPGNLYPGARSPVQEPTAPPRAIYAAPAVPAPVAPAGPSQSDKEDVARMASRIVEDVNTLDRYIQEGGSISSYTYSNLGNSFDQLVALPAPPQSDPAAYYARATHRKR